MLTHHILFDFQTSLPTQDGGLLPNAGMEASVHSEGWGILCGFTLFLS